MGLFSSILEKIGFGKAEAAPLPPSGPGAAPDGTMVPPPTVAPTAPSGQPPTIDVTAKLDGLAASHAEKLNWKVSIVDLLKLLDLDSSLTARKELATELGCPADKMGDSAQMNIWLHKTVMRKLAENGGNIPAELLN